MLLVLAVLCSLLLAGCTGPAVSTQPESLFDAHCQLCPQCSRPIMSPDGTENSLCEAGFQAFQEDVRRAMANQTSDTGPR